MPSFVLECAGFLEDNADEMCAILEQSTKETIVRDRLGRLLACRRDLRSIMKLTGIEYWAPADASTLPIPPKTIDYQYSISVLEHVPPLEIVTILTEARRVLKSAGLAVHIIDPSDHFSHSDPSINSINFLQYEERDWKRIAGNRLSYHNRLRVSDFQDIFRNIGLQLKHEKRFLDQRAIDDLKSGLRIADKFRHHGPEDLATRRVDVVGTFEHGQKEYQEAGN
jgi:ubiquinone/menaquinone biosynthesis C-methylase UbiE